MLDKTKETLTIHVNVQISAAALQTFTTHAKTVLKQQDGLTPRMDTADYIGVMISQFLAEKNFETYLRDPRHYQPPQ